MQDKTITGANEICIERHKSEDAGKIDEEVEERVEAQEECDAEIVCGVSRNGQLEEMCMPVQEKRGSAKRCARSW